MSLIAGILMMNIAINKSKIFYLVFYKNILIGCVVLSNMSNISKTAIVSTIKINTPYSELSKKLSEASSSKIILTENIRFFNEEMKDDINFAKKIADMLNTSYYHTSYTDDLNGVEVSAAIKNIFSMAVGAARGLCSKNISSEVREKNYLNTASALIKQSIHEMEIFVEHLNGKKILGLIRSNLMPLVKIR